MQGDASITNELDRTILEIERENGKCKRLVRNLAVLVSEKTLKLKVEIAIYEFAISVDGALVAAKSVWPIIIKLN